jgi:Na+-transporting methylmalonyl-CoA/oxaloacetate decarboxylase gamma subunit
MNSDARFSSTSSSPSKTSDAKASSLRPAGWGFFIYLILLVILTVWIGPLIAQSNREVANPVAHPVAAAASTPHEKATYPALFS